MAGWAVARRGIDFCSADLPTYRQHRPRYGLAGDTRTWRPGCFLLPVSVDVLPMGWKLLSASTGVSIQDAAKGAWIEVALLHGVAGVCQQPLAARLDSGQARRQCRLRQKPAVITRCDYRYVGAITSGITADRTQFVGDRCRRVTCAGDCAVQLTMVPASEIERRLSMDDVASLRCFARVSNSMTWKVLCRQDAGRQNHAVLRK